MNFRELFKQESVKFIFSVFATTIGVFIGLWINGKVQTNKDQDAYRTILKSINIEATANKTISEESFRKNIRRMVYRGFSYKMADEFLSNKIFLDNASGRLVHCINEYILNLKRANALMQAEDEFKNIPQLEKKYGDTLRLAWDPVLDRCDSSINLLIHFTDSLIVK